MRLLLEAGADPNAAQQGGITALDAARHHGDEEIARLLLDHGARAG
jgi:ankyrin repeat protein